MNTKELIYKMLTENTGAHMLDSGGAYGRNWERNQSKTIEDFENEPDVHYTSNGLWIDRRVSVFHYLSQLETDWRCDAFNQIPCENWDAEDVYGVSKEQWEWLTSGYDMPVKVLRTFNTYNGDSDLSQILQGAWLDIDGESYILLQIHGGCDARGGYTDAKLFKTPEEGCIHEYLQEYMYQDEILEYELEYISVYKEDGSVWDKDELKELIENK
jgi:hypothetical protein